MNGLVNDLAVDLEFPYYRLSSAPPFRRLLLGAHSGTVPASRPRASGEIGAVLRHHGLYSSHLTKWRQEREAGILDGLTPHKRGPKTKVTAATLENRKLQRENERLTEQLRKAEIVIDVQKKVAALLGRPFPETETL